MLLVFRYSINRLCFVVLQFLFDKGLVIVNIWFSYLVFTIYQFLLDALYLSGGFCTNQYAQLRREWHKIQRGNLPTRSKKRVCVSVHWVFFVITCMV